MARDAKSLGRAKSQQVPINAWDRGITKTLDGLHIQPEQLTKTA